MTSSLVGSEMCIRDRCMCVAARVHMRCVGCPVVCHRASAGQLGTMQKAVSYTHLTLPTICSV
eukprot:1764780-Prorocentrum_lima.AAC.1